MSQKMQKRHTYQDIHTEVNICQEPPSQKKKKDTPIRKQYSTKIWKCKKDTYQDIHTKENICQETKKRKKKMHQSENKTVHKSGKAEKTHISGYSHTKKYMPRTKRKKDTTIWKQNSV